MAATASLYGTIADLRERIRSLETALNTIHLGRTERTHPILATSRASDDWDSESGDDDDDTIDELAQQLHDKATLIQGRDGAQRIASGAFDKFWVTHVNIKLLYASMLLY